MLGDEEEVEPGDEQSMEGNSLFRSIIDDRLACYSHGFFMTYFTTFPVLDDTVDIHIFSFIFNSVHISFPYSSYFSYEECNTSIKMVRKCRTKMEDTNF